MGHLKTGLCDKELSHFYSVVQEYFPLDHTKILSSGKVLFWQLQLLSIFGFW